MKNSRIIAKSMLIATLATSVAQADTQTLWVSGVNQESGWVDVNKNSTKGDADDNLCYAAVASNLITWWQRNYTTLPSTPSSADAIWETYKAAAADAGGSVGNAIQWWISGVYSAQTEEEKQRSVYEYGDQLLETFEGFYYDEYLSTTVFADEFNSFYNKKTSGITANDIISAVQNGCGIALNLNIGHVVTLWGVDCDADGNLIGLWLTDSDLAYHNPDAPQGLFAEQIVMKGDKIYLAGDEHGYYEADEDISITGIFTINPEVSNSWGIPVVPEPATATLSLLALAALAARRRRTH